MFDLVIRGGDVIDGTGAPRTRADVAIKDGRIVAIGRVDGDAARVIDADGKIVSPGFIDVHTHFDAQAFWDGALTPSPLHGVTTALAGNCGFTIAPLSDDAADADYLMRMLARVEGMPLESLQEGVPWSWRTTAEYLDALEGRVGPNIAVMVGHSAIRRVTMGADANKRAATADEIDAMSRLLRDGLEAGGLGLSSSWARTHNDADGQMVPSRHANVTELMQLCRVTGEFPGTSLEFLPMVGPFEQWAKELMAEMSVAAQRPLNWNILVITQANAAGIENQLSAGDVARERGGRVVALTIPKISGIRLSFASGFLLDAMPGWETVMGLPRAYKKAILADPAARADLTGRRGASSARSVPRIVGTRAAPSVRSRPSGAATRSTCCATSPSPTTCSPASAWIRPCRPTRSGSCVSTSGATAAPSSAPRMRAPISTCSPPSTTRPRCSEKPCAKEDYCLSKKPCNSSPRCPPSSTASSIAAGSPKASVPTSWSSIRPPSPPRRRRSAPTFPVGRPGCTQGPRAWSTSS
jgi:hypothetical protein